MNRLDMGHVIDLILTVPYKEELSTRSGLQTVPSAIHQRAHHDIAYQQRGRSAHHRKENSHLIQYYAYATITSPVRTQAYGAAVHNYQHQYAAYIAAVQAAFQRTAAHKLCIHCGLSFSSQGNLNRHIRTAHRGRRIECNHSSYRVTLTQLADLRKHKRRRHSWAPGRCPQARTLVAHVRRTHTGLTKIRF